jgi:processive 1,2-diacylglycerol beta-glucosyltransferase
MKNSLRILILTASYGDGHLQAAHALKQSFLQEGIGQVFIIDLMKEAHPLLNKISTSLYLKSAQISQFGLDYYGWSYYMTRNAKYNEGWHRYFNFLGKRKLKEKIEQKPPDAIISTFPFGAAAELCSMYGIPSFTVITDFTLHARWVHPCIDTYYVASEELKTHILKKFQPSSSIQVTGIPIRSAFERAVPTGSNPFLVHFDPKRKLILIFAGSYGVLGCLEEMIDAILSIENCQCAVICGRNQKLENRIRKQYAGHPHFHIFGFVENIHELMSLASCMVTKAGGLTLSEAVSLQVPLFIYKPFGGQEKENAAFFSEKGMAAVSNHAEELLSQIRHFFSNSLYAFEMKHRMASMQRKSASIFIVKDVVSKIRQQISLSCLK